MSSFAQSQNIGYGIGAASVIAAITMALSGSPRMLSAATFGIGGGILGTTAVAGVRMSRREDELKAAHVQASIAASDENDRRKRELDAQLETAQNGYAKAVVRAKELDTQLDECKRSNGSLAANLESVKASYAAAQETLEQLKGIHNELKADHAELIATSDEEWKAKEEVDRQLLELQLKLNRAQKDIDNEIKLHTIEGTQPAVQKAVAHAIEAKMTELEAAHADIQKLLATLQESNDQIVDVQESALPYIKQVFDTEVNARDSQLMQLSGENSQLKEEITRLMQPRMFPGLTSIDGIGNQIIQEFYARHITLDALDAATLPSGFRLRFKCDRNSSQAKLTEDEFKKMATDRGFLGISRAPIEFKIDPANLIVSVEIAMIDPATLAALSTATGKTATVATATEAIELASAAIGNDAAFRALGCFPASEFENVIRDKFVPRVRVVAGSTGGKSPLMELISVAIAKLNQAELWLLNPLPGSPKDWFSVPGRIKAGSDGIQDEIAYLEAAHQELKDRRENLGGAKKFIMICADEVNALARDYENLGTVLKDFYQLSDHAQMGIITAGQGANVSGVSGGAPKKNGNAGKLMEEDFQNATQVFTSQAAKVWLTKHHKDLLPKLAELEKLCSQLNESEGLSARPKPGTKVVDRAAYRIALVVSPASDEPFFIQIPAYSFYADKLDGVSFPVGSVITAPYENQVALGLAANPDECPSCGSTNTKVNKTLKASVKRVCGDCKHYYNVPKSAALAG